ncbi:MAG TPA: bifunctional 4-hydroxy-2-oxoglutarate aldolase/2-dehydro-3-deoxy-phosphogluconate aldolase [Micromonospora sp.]
MSLLTSADIVGISPVVPVVVVADLELAVPTARALASGGVGIVEITLRTAAGLDAIRRVAAEVPEITVGAGTVTSPEQVDQVRRAGAAFVVLPGAPDRLLDAAIDSGLPVLPGASTITEMMRLADRGQGVQKFFPAEPSGGSRFLTSVAGPLPDLLFCPTGGIDECNAATYLALPNVGCVGGSWITPRDAVRSRDWPRIADLARQAVSLRSRRAVPGDVPSLREPAADRSR